MDASPGHGHIQLEKEMKLSALILTLTLTGLAGAEEDLRVLPTKSAEVPSRNMMARYLKRLAYQALDDRRASYEKLKTNEQIEKYQKRLRGFFVQQLGGLPKRTALNPRIVGKIEEQDYRIEKIIYESQPGDYVTALLYLPKTKPPYPGVLVPCGHTANGKVGYQRPCIFLAKYGIAALCYDPIGQGERYQILDNAGRPRFKSTTEHTLIGAGCIPLGRNTATYRVWDGMRALDYLCSREDIDAKRIGCTGNSGGGTLTEYLMALDPRIQCAAPSCCVTTFRRRLDTIGPGDAEQNVFGQIAFGLDHADYTILRAPKPTLLCAATHDYVDIRGSWEIFREAKRLYGRMGFSERVDLVEADGKHGFSKPIRVAMVRWMRRWLSDIDEPVTEPDIKTHPAKVLQCSPMGQVLLMKGAKSVTDLNVELDKELEKQRTKTWHPDNRAKALQEVREIAGIRKLDDLSRPVVRRVGKIKREGYVIEKMVMQTEPGILLPVLLFVPAKPKGGRALYLDGNGKHVDASPSEAIEKLVQQGKVVLTIDLRGTGETGGSTDNLWGGSFDDFFLAYLLGRSMVGMRTEDVLIAGRFLAEWQSKEAPVPIDLMANNGAVPPAIHAAALEAQLFSSLQVGRHLPSWSQLVREPALPPVEDWSRRFMVPCAGMTFLIWSGVTRT